LIPRRDEVLAKVREFVESPVAIEAFWDGDTTGWFVVLTALFPSAAPAGTPFREVALCSWREGGGDMRLFNGQVPPWPEARYANDLGREVAGQLSVPFYFGSPEHPEDSCPRWWEREAGYPCAACGIPLLQRQPCPWRGVCYWCHLEKERTG
jgi:hypothetical protein